MHNNEQLQNWILLYLYNKKVCPTDKPSKQDVHNNKDECDKKIEKLKNFLKTATSSSSLGGNCLTVEEKGIIDNAINGNNLDAHLKKINRVGRQSDKQKLQSFSDAISS